MRSALPSDSRAIAALHAASWRFAYRGALSEEYLAGDIVADRNILWKTRLSKPPANQYVVVAEIDGALAGFACAYLGEDREWGSLLDNIHVRPEAYRKGLGSALLQAVAARGSLVAGTAGLYLWVLQDNTSAQSFYEHYGARNVGTDLWHAPGGTQVPRFRFAWPATRLPTRP
jgi:ribosomal protein S18 acetylase RimI-like enzyme